MTNSVPSAILEEQIKDALRLAMASGDKTQAKMLLEIWRGTKCQKQRKPNEEITELTNDERAVLQRMKSLPREPRRYLMSILSAMLEVQDALDQ